MTPAAGGGDDQLLHITESARRCAVNEYHRAA